MNRFFVEKEKIRDGRARIEGGDFRHAARVLRMGPGDALIVCDGEGHEYEGRVLHTGEAAMEVELLEEKLSKGELPYEITLIQGLPKSDKMEWIVQKCTELGISRFIPTLTARCVARPKAAEFEKRRERYERIALEAAMQSRRGVRPSVEGLRELGKIDYSPYDLLLFCYEEEEAQSLRMALEELAARPKRIALFIGPEGGFEPEEAAWIRAQGGLSVHLGRRILRTETAGMAALAMLQYALGED